MSHMLGSGIGPQTPNLAPQTPGGGDGDEIIPTAIVIKNIPFNVKRETLLDIIVRRFFARFTSIHLMFSRFRPRCQSLPPMLSTIILISPVSSADWHSRTSASLWMQTQSLQR